MKKNDRPTCALSLKRGVDLKIYWTDIAWVASIGALFVICIELFYRMIVNYNDVYGSDMRYYAVKIVEEEFIADRIVEKLSQLFYSINQSTMEFNIYLAAVVAGIVVANFLVIRFYLKRDEMLGTVPRYMAQAASLAALFTGPVYVPVLHEYYYRHSFEAFAWHNPTQQTMMLLSLPAILCFLKMYLDHEEGVSPVWWAATSILMLLSAAAKPSFIIDMVVCVVVMFLIDLFSGEKETMLTRFRRLFVMGCSLIPAGLYTLWLNSKEFGEDTLNGGEFYVVFGLKALRDHPDFLSMMLFGMMFSIVVTAVNFRRFRDSKYFLALMLFVTGFLQWALISETGERANHGNFSWGRMFGSYYLALICLTLLLENICDRDSVFPGRPRARKIYLVIACIVLAMSVLSQLNYFKLILTGHGYMR